MRQALVLAGLCSTLAVAAPARVLLSIGHDVGGAGDARLAWAEADARRVRDVFVELGGVRAADAELVLGRPAAEVEAAIDRLAARVAQRREGGGDVMVVVYVSSHARQGTLRLGGTELSMERLRARVEALQATLKLLVLDACSSGAAVRLKGGRLTTVPTRVEVEPARGLVVLTSSGPAEPAQEWDSLQGSLFSHYWLGALRGDADVNRDGAITVLEAYTHAWRQTLAHADQHPSFDFDLRGSGEVVLTEPLRSPSALSFPAGLAGRFVVADEPEARLVLELDRDARTPLRLAVPPGTYRVRRSGPEGTGVVTLELGAGTVRALSAADFVAGPSTQVALKGGSRGLTLGLGATLRGADVDAPLVGGAGFLRYDVSALWLMVQLAVDSGRAARGQDLEAGLGLAVGLGVETGLVRLSLGLVARPMLGARRTLEGERTVAGGLEGGGLLGVDLTLGGSLFLGAQLEGLVRVSGLEPTLDPSLTWRVSAFTGLRF